MFPKNWPRTPEDHPHFNQLPMNWKKVKEIKPPPGVYVLLRLNNRTICLGAWNGKDWNFEIEVIGVLVRQGKAHVTHWHDLDELNKGAESVR